MPGFNSAIDAMLGTMRRVKGTRATYVRGSSSVPVVAIPARTGVDLQNEEGAITRMTSDDFLIEVSALVVDGAPVQPALGDRITVDGTNYDLVDLPGEGCWRHCDQNRSNYRIHTRRTS